MAILDVVVPQLSESVSEATMLTWKKKPGSAVEIDEILIEVETDKVVLEIPAPASGILIEIIKDDESIVKSGEVIARIDTLSKTIVPSQSTDINSDSIPEKIPNSLKKVTASPSATKILLEKGLDVNKISGTGPDGRIIKADAIDAKTDAIGTIESITEKSDVLTEIISNNDQRSEKRVPMSRLRARISERLLQSQKENAILTTFNEVNMQSIINLRSRYKDKFSEKHGIKLGFMSFFVKAAITALKKYPILNASVDGQDIVYHEYFDIGIAIGSPRGLVVPILRNSDQLSISEIEKYIADFGQRASVGKLSLSEMTGGTFSISNGGIFGSMLSTPIINPPQSAILGIHLTKERPIVENGQIVIRPMNYLAMSYDHRIIDGREAVLGLVSIKDALEDPQRLLLDL